ncbi:hypothetical protein P3T76_015397 [Phytophthora citrophthora]|uniref:Elicitin n=1 Tax=Phytophthora citrophthora TaxID=4793 RepID=A0AAD9FZE3_9STRA|nr:hypothetical protein P3T76_015397 [Phytophthora citrophthora]
MKIPALLLFLTATMSTSFAADCTEEEMASISSAMGSEYTSVCPSSTGTDMDAFCSNSACLTYVNSIINDFPDCTTSGVSVKEHVQGIVDGCGSTSTAASGASTDNSTETTATSAATESSTATESTPATESSTATESTVGTDSSTAVGSTAGTEPTVGTESSTASGSSADTGSSSSASSVALSASMAVVVGILAVTM